MKTLFTLEKTKCQFVVELNNDAGELLYILKIFIGQKVICRGAF